jgi:serine/threonine protein kinase/signal transduction histidine kinase
VRKSDSRPVIIKTRKNPEDEYLLKREYEILKENHMDGVANVLNLVYGSDNAYLIMEDKGAVVLNSYLENKSLTVREFVTVAKNAASALSTIHKRGIIHRDVKPANMLIDVNTLDIYFIDFGISISRDDEKKLPRDGLAGTREFISPEQTGRVNLPVDFRSDLYSLGITLYYLLTRRMPFDYKTSMQLLHAHIAVMPPPPSHVANVSEVLSDIVMKLIQKSPDDRYMSAESLEYDFVLCLSQLNKDRMLKKFPLGTADSFVRLIPENYLMGRDSYFKQLRNIYNHISGRRAEAVIISGPPYSGKSELTAEFEEFVLKSDGICLHAVYDYKKLTEPYYAISRAFRQYYNRLVNYGTDLSGLKRVLLHNLGGNAGTLLKMMPFLSDLIGEHPEPAALSYAEEKRRNQHVFTTFLQVITSSALPIVLLVDNAQSADRQSLQMLLAAMRDENVLNFMAVLSMRPEEYETNPQVQDLIAEFDTPGIKVTHINLEYLTTSDIRDFLEELFGDYSQGTDDLVDYIFNLTGGRPYEVTNLVNALSQKKLLKYDGEKQSFVWDLEEIKRTDFNLDAQSKYRELYESLSESARSLLDYLSVYGSVYYDRSLDESELSFKMKPLTDVKILSETGQGTYRFEDSLFRVFVSNSLNITQRMKLHYEIGKNMYEEYKNDPKDWARYCESITSHFNEAEPIINGLEERLLVARLNLETGNMCLNTSDATNATVYYKKGLSVCGSAIFNADYKLAVDLSINCALSCLAKENFADFETVSAKLLENIQNDEDKFRYYNQTMKQCVSAGKYRFAISLGEKYLEGKEILLEEQADPALSYKQYERLFTDIVMHNPINPDADLEFAKDENALRTGSITALLSDAMWSLKDERSNYYHFVVYCFAAQNGIFDNFDTVFYNGALRAVKSMNYEIAEHLINQCIRYTDRYGGSKSRALVRLGGLISHWRNPIEKTFDIYKEAKMSASTEGLNRETTLADLMILDTRFFLTCAPLEVGKEIDLAIQNAGISSLDLCSKILSGVLRQFVKCVTGKTNSPDSFSDVNFNEDEFVAKNAEEQTIMYYYHSYKLIALVVNARYEQAQEHAEKLEPMWTVQSGSLLMVMVSFFYTILLVCLSNKMQNKTYAVAAKSNQKLLQEWAEKNPGNFREWYLCAQVAIEITEDEPRKLMPTYTEALQLLTAKKNSPLLAIVHELMATFWRGKSVSDYSSHHRYTAYRVYKDYGFFAKWSALEPLISDYALYSNRDSSISLSQSTDMLLTNKNIDIEAILSIVTTLTQDVNISVMSSALLECLIQNSGATRGFVVILQDSRPIIESVYYSAIQPGNISLSLLPMPLSKAEEMDFPVKAVEYVLSKKVTLNINYATEKHLLFSDIYYKIHNPEAFICVPMRLNEKVIGAVYLENNSLSGIFSAERVNMVSTIISQTAPLFQNAIYYDELNDYANTVEKRLKEHSTLLNSMIAGIAHEINTPVGVCVTVVSHMLNLTKLSREKFGAQTLSKTDLVNYFEEILKGCAIAEANVSRAVGLIQNFKKVSANQSNEVFESLNLYTTLTNIVEYIRPAIKKKISDIEITGDENFTFVSCAGALTQIFTNLIMNSVIHGFENKPRDNCRIKIAYDSDNTHVTITYSDNGKGMTEDEITKLFQPFYTTKRQFGGSGLGTHIVFTHVTQTLNGKVLCKSEPGKSTDFIIKLPV